MGARRPAWAEVEHWLSHLGAELGARLEEECEHNSRAATALVAAWSTARHGHASRSVKLRGPSRADAIAADATVLIRRWADERGAAACSDGALGITLLSLTATSFLERDGASADDADALLWSRGRCSRRGLCSLRGAPFVCQSLVTGGAPKGWRGLPGGAPFCCSSGSSCFGVVGAPKEPPSLRHAGRKLRLGCVPASAIAADPQVSPRCGGSSC